MSAVVCPTVTAFSAQGYGDQMRRIQGFAMRIHIDFMDGIFAPTTSIVIDEAWWQPGPAVDLHVMYQKPLDYLEELVALKPHLIIIHAEANEPETFLKELDGLGIKKGLAVLQATNIEDIKDLVMLVDHVLIFSGDLGHFGGTVDINMLKKVVQLKELKPSLEIGWDGGINVENIQALQEGGVSVLNVGGFIQKAKDPEAAYDTLETALKRGTHG